MSKEFIPGKSYIPVSGPSIGQEEYQNVLHVLDRGWFTEGHYVNKFADKLARKTDNRYVEMCNSGSSANLLAVSALVDRTIHNRYVITCAVGFPTTLSPIYQNNQVPLFIDIDPETLQPSMGHLEYALEHYGKDVIGAILPHTLGFVYNERLAKQLLRDRWLISDTCDALGATIYEKPVGSFSDVSTYSFFPAHQICAVEGGAVVTNREDIYKKVRSLNNWGRDCWCKPGQKNVCGKRFCQEFDSLPEGWDHKYTFTEVGYNLKMTEFQAAFGVAQMDKLDDFVEQRRNTFSDLWYGLEEFQDDLQFLSLANSDSASPFGFPITVRTNKFTAQEFISFLEQHKIGTRRVFGGNLVRQPAFKPLPYVSCTFDNADYVMERTFWIGCGPWMTDDMIGYIWETFVEWFRKYA